MNKVASVALSAVLAISMFPAGLAFADNSALTQYDDRPQFDSSDACALLSEMGSADEGVLDASSLIVTLKDDADISSVSSAAQGANIDVISDDEDGKILHLKCDGESGVSDVVDRLAGNQAVATVQPNYYYKLFDSVSVDASLEGAMEVHASSNAYEVNDPYAHVTTTNSAVPNQWYLDKINARDAWNISRTSGAVTVAVIDSGINFSHEDLAGVVDKANARQFYYTDFQAQTVASNPYYTSETTSDYAHGTHVAGIVAAEANNGKGFAGVSYNARVLPIKTFFDYKGESYTTDALVAHAYKYIFDLVKAGRSDIKVINLSLGGDNVNAALMDCISRAKNTYNILTVCAAGNDDKGTPVYPADLDECIAVTSVDSSGARASFSNYGSAKDIAAPGVGIWSTWIGSSSAKDVMNGTSMSAPMVSACAAMLWAYNPRLSVDEVKRIIYASAAPIEETSEYIGCGILDVQAALKLLSDSLPATRITQGTTAMDTSAAISRESIARSNSVIIARDDDFADSMSATGLAGALGAPVLLSSAHGISSSVAAEIQRLGATKAYVIGGERALPSAALEATLKGAGIVSAERIKGSESWDTSVKCAEKIAELKRANGDDDFKKVIVATPTSFQDAVSMSSFAYKYSVPIILQEGGGSSASRHLGQAALNLINSTFPEASIYVPGGKGAVSIESSEGVFGNSRVVRLTEGTTAYDTSNAIAKYMVSQGYLSPSRVTVACGADAAKGVDALAGGSIAGINSSPMLLINGNPSIERVDETVLYGFISENRSAIGSAYVLGGKGAIPQTTFVDIAYRIR